jgi:prevent-host-death family protein
MTNMATTSPYVNIAEAKARLSELVEKAARGEEIIIARDHKPVARLVAVESPRSARASGSAKGQVWMSPDFDDTPTDFIDYI